MLPSIRRYGDAARHTPDMGMLDMDSAVNDGHADTLSGPASEESVVQAIGGWNAHVKNSG